MKKIISIFVVLLLVVFACKKSENATEDESYVKGKADIYVDESLLPIVEDQELVFENKYQKADIKLIPQSDSDIVNLLLQRKIDIAVLSHELTPTQEKTLKDRDVIGKNTPFGSDAIALIVNQTNSKVAITTSEIFEILKGKKTDYQFVFDNENSSALSYLMNKAGVKSLPKSVTALKNNLEVIKFVSENSNSIGFVGVNWLLNPSLELESTVKKVNVLAVGSTIENAVKPTQEYIETQEYPFVRKIYLLNYQGRTGLGMGFASFIKSEVGQRIILKSGLVPVKIPTREIRIVKNNKKK
ncbi:PstS family phosphate ABC transporter substrate-binding protein [Flavobacterium terrigena]|uniref:Phosphate transport system substrate-binding protein n=1 Tax=Flavobacterium terrigena TaxID=402734 RepID=A0A1H6WJ59_9FLAO|nr:substrate-binding domain-containing protein [Flavobacterium terrigena]SEJ16923.1 phosphate transport system substrate-binding protein [Flavobacterium terrigena]